MDLVERYLAAVRRNLPAATQADDIVDELRDDVLTRVEMREDATGRRLSDPQVAELLKDVGHPLLVAGRFRRSQWLIGPDVFPFYVYTLRIVLLVIAATIAIGIAASAILGHRGPGPSVLGSVGGGWNAMISAVGVVTIVFFALERAGFPADHLRKWRPEQLPAVKDQQPGVWTSAFEVAGSIATILWWIGWLPIPFAGQGARDLGLRPDPIWAAVWNPVLALFIARLAHSLVQLLRPRWRVTRGLLSIATTLGALALLVVIHRAGHWLTVVSTTQPAARVAEIDRSVNIGIQWTLLIVGAVFVFACGQELWRLIARRSPRGARW